MFSAAVAGQSSPHARKEIALRLVGDELAADVTPPHRPADGALVGAQDQAGRGAAVVLVEAALGFEGRDGGELDVDGARPEGRPDAGPAQQRVDPQGAPFDDGVVVLG